MSEHEMHVHGAHDHELQHRAQHGDGLAQRIAILTAVLATVGAVVSFLGGHTQNEALYHKNNAVLKKAQASDQWNYYQAKSQKESLAKFAATIIADPDKQIFYAKEADRYAKEEEEIKAKAEAFEKESLAADNRSEEALHPHEKLAVSMTFLQIAIALAFSDSAHRKVLAALWRGPCCVGRMRSRRTGLLHLKLRRPRSVRGVFLTQKCPYCNAAPADSDDHIFPQFLGGRRTVRACRRCNNKFGHEFEGPVSRDLAHVVVQLALCGLVPPKRTTWFNAFKDPDTGFDYDLHSDRTATLSRPIVERAEDGSVRVAKYRSSAEAHKAATSLGVKREGTNVIVSEESKELMNPQFNRASPLTMAAEIRRLSMKIGVGLARVARVSTGPRVANKVLMNRSSINSLP